MTVSGCLGDKSRCGILETLQFGKMHSWCTIKKTVAVINACLYKQFRGDRRQGPPYLSDIIQVMVNRLTSLVDLFCHFKVNVKSRNRVADGRTYNWH